MRTWVLLHGLAAVVSLAPQVLLAQRAGQVTRAIQPAFIEPAGARRTVGTDVAGVKAEPQTPFKWGDSLVTGPAGRLRAQLGDGSLLTLGQNSRLRVERHDERSQQTDMQLQYGRIRAQVVRLSRPDSRFEVRTHTAVCGVLGTDEVVDADSPVATVVIAIDGVLVVRSSDPNVVGSVQLTAGQATVVEQGKPPSPPQQASPEQLNNAVQNTTGDLAPEAAVNLPNPQIEAGKTITVDARQSTGGSGGVASYLWAIPQRSFTSSDPVLNLDTTGWTPGQYTGTLTVTSTTGKTATVGFRFLVVPPPAPVGTPADAITALARAYESLQVRNFMNSFDPAKYSGYAALEQSVTNSFANIQENRVFVRTANGTATGATAIMQVDFEIRFTPKSTALPSIGFTQPQAVAGLAAFGGRSGLVAGSISGSAGAVATFVTITSPAFTQTVQTPHNSTQYTFANVPDGTYTVTPLRNGFQFTPATRTVTVSGAAIAGVDFTAVPQTQIVREQSTLRMELVQGRGWVITDIQGSLGSAGLVGIPGTTMPTVSNIPPAANETPAPGGGTTPGGTTPGGTARGFTVTSPGTHPALRGGATAPAPLTITPQGGFADNVAVTFNPPTGVTVSGPGVVAVGASAVTTNYVFNVGANAPTGAVLVPYTATAGTLSQQGAFNLSITALNLAISGPGVNAATPLPVVSGGANNTTLVVTSTPPGFSGPLTFSFVPSAPGITASVGPVNYGPTAATAPLFVSSTATETGPFQLTVTATPVNGSPLTATVFGTRIEPIAPGGVRGPESPVLVAPGSPGTVAIDVSFAGGFAGSALVTAPSVPGLTFTPPSATLTSSGRVTFTVTAGGSSALDTLSRERLKVPVNAVFTVTVGAFSAQVNVVIDLLPAYDISLSSAALTLVQGASGTATITVTQAGGIALQTINVTATGIPSGLTVTGGGTVSAASGAVTFTVNAAPSATLGTLSFTVQAAALSLTRTSTVTVTVISAGTFTLAGPSAPLEIFDTMTGSVTVSVVPAGGFTGSVALTFSAVGATVTGPAAILAGGTGAYTITPSADSGSVTFTGTAATLTRTLVVNFTRIAPFKLFADPVNSFPGGSFPAKVEVRRAPGFTGTVIVTAVSAPAGTTLSPAAITVGGSSGEAVFTSASSATAVDGPLNFSGMAQGGAITVPLTTRLILRTPFQMRAGNPLGPGAADTIEVYNGQTTKVGVQVNFAPGFTDPVTIVPAPVPRGVTAINPLTPTTLSSDGIVVFEVLGDVPPLGDPGIFVTGRIGFVGKSGSFLNNATVDYRALPPFLIDLDKSPVIVFEGDSETLRVGITPAPGFSGSVMVGVGGGVLPPGVRLDPATPDPQTVFVSGRTLVKFTFQAAPESGPATASGFVGAEVGRFRHGLPVTLAVVPPFKAVPARDPIRLFRGFPRPIRIDVTFAPRFTGSVTLVPGPRPAGVAAYRLLGPSTLTETGSFLVEADISPTAAAGPVELRFGVTNGSVAYPVRINADFFDPYSLIFTNPSAPAASTSGTFGVTITQAPTISGDPPPTINVTVTPKSAPGGAATFSPSSLTVPVSGTVNVTFTVTFAGGAGPSVTLGADTSAAAFSLAQSAPALTLSPAFTVSATLAGTVFTGLPALATATVTFAPGYSGTVTVGVPGPLPPGIASVTPVGGATVSTSGGTVTFNVVGGGPGSGSLIFGGMDAAGNTALAPGVPYTALDPFTVSAATPASPAASTSRTFTVTVTGAAGFTGSVVVTPGSVPIASATFSPASQTVLVSGVTPVTFTVTFKAAISSVNLGATATAGGFSPSAATGSFAVAKAFTLAVTPGGPLFTGLSSTATITVTFAAGYSGSVIVTPPGTLPPGIASITPPSAVVSTSGGTAVFTLTGSGPASGTIGVTGADGDGNVDTVSGSYSVADPYAVTVIDPAAPVFSSVPTSFTVGIGPAAGFSGSVTVTPSAPGATFSPTSQTVAVAGPTPANFTVTFGGGTTSASITANTSTGGFSRSASGGALVISAPFALSISPTPMRVVNAVATAFPVTITYAPGYSGSVTIAAPGVALPGIASISPATGVATGSGPVPFTITGSAAGTGSMTWTASDPLGNTTSLTVSYAVVEPFALTYVVGPDPLCSGTNNLIRVGVIYETGFFGSVVTINAPGVLPSGVADILPRTTTVSASSIVNFTVLGDISPGVVPNTLLTSGVLTFTAVFGGISVPLSAPYSTVAPLTFSVPPELVSFTLHIPIGLVGTISTVVTPASCLTGAVEVAVAGSGRPFTGSLPVGMVNASAPSVTSTPAGSPTTYSFSFGNSSFVGSSPTGGISYFATNHVSAFGMSFANPEAELGSFSVSAGDLTLSAQDVHYSPPAPEAGELVRFRVRVSNNSAERREGEVLLMRGDAIVARQRLEAGGKRRQAVDLEWRAEPLHGRRLALRLIDLSEMQTASKTSSGRDTLALRGFYVAARGGAARRLERLTLQVRNEACAGIRLAAMSSSGCGGSVDLEVTPLVTSDGHLLVEALAPEGGLRDLGPMLLTAGAAFPAAGGTLASRARLEEGHTYLVESRGQQALVRVKRVRSAIAPRLAAVLGGGVAADGSDKSGRGPTLPGKTGGGSGLLDDLRDQERAGRLLDSNLITVELEVFR